MRKIRTIWFPGILAALLSLPLLAEEPAGPTGLLKRAASVDKPIPETYEPLNSTYVGDGEKLNQTIEQSWQLKKEAREQGAADRATPASAVGGSGRETLESRIQEPGPGPAPIVEPQVQDTGKSLEIKGD
jgi:hypothetical protein